MADEGAQCDVGDEEYEIVDERMFSGGIHVRWEPQRLQGDRGAVEEGAQGRELRVVAGRVDAELLAKAMADLSVTGTGAVALEEAA